MEEEKLWIGHRKHEIDKEMRTICIHLGHQLLEKQHVIQKALGSNQWTGYQSFTQQLLAIQRDTGKAVGSDQPNVGNSDAFNYGGFNHRIYINPEHPVDIDQLEVCENLKAASIKSTAEHCIADVRNSGTLNYGEYILLRSPILLDINITSDYAKYLYARGTPLDGDKYEDNNVGLYLKEKILGSNEDNNANVRNSGTIDYGEIMPATLHLNKVEYGLISEIELQKICEKHGMEAARLEEKSRGSDQYNSCSLHLKFQSLLNSLKALTMSVPPYVLSCYEQLKIWMGFKADYTENTEVDNFPLPSVPEDNSLTYKDFICYMRDNMLTVDPRYHVVFLLLVNIGVLEIFSIFLFIAAPYFFFSDLNRLATKTGVSCGSMKLPAFWFTVLAAIGISSMFVFATLVMSYTRWRLSIGKPRVGDVDGAILEGLPEVLQG
ncbi:calcium-dependent protein kinase [Trifolium repens]|nr:calcium-dependent protein kinase [Trifolium repens]